MPERPVIGAALRPRDLPRFLPWLAERDRDLELQGFDKPEMLDGDWRTAVAEARAALAGWSGRLGMHGPYAGLVLDARDPEARALARRRILAALEVAEALGARQMVLHSPYTLWKHQNLDTLSGAREGMIARVQDTLADAVARAEAAGVTLVIENIEDVDPRDRTRLAQSFGSDAVKLSIDTGHAEFAHGSTGAPPVDVFVALAGADLAHVHLQDADGHADRHWRLGRGRIRWPAVFAALAASGADPHLVLELRDVEDILPSHAYLVAEGLAE